MRVAVLADIHGNLPALDAVLTELDGTDVDRIVLLGDIALGPLPAETLDRLVDLGDRALWVHGNCERELVAAYDGPIGADANAEMAAACAGIIERRHRDLLDELPLTLSVELDGLGPALFCHATPRRDDEFVLVDSPPDRWEAALAGVQEPLVICGHTHMPFDRLVAGRRVVNPGSVGMAYGPAGAYYAVIGPTVQLRRTAYDVEAATSRIRAGRHPQAASWAREYVLEPHGDAEALAAFTDIANGQP
jgi:predicted phosphodiesterase